MNIRITGALLGFALAVAQPAFADETAPEAGKAEAAAHEDWVADFDQAVEKARAEKKDLLVDFTGSDWCGWCKRLDSEVFSHDDFLAAAKKDYVLVALDFPNAAELKAKVPNPDRNQELAKKYGVRGYPTILLMNADGDVFGQTGYQAGGSAKYVEHIGKLRADGLPALKSAKAIVAEIAAAPQEGKSAAREKAIDALAALDEGAATARLLSAAVREAFDGDPENKSGVRARAAKALLVSGTADESVFGAVTTLDPKNDLGLLERSILARGSRLSSAEAAKTYYGEVEALFAGAGPKDAKVKKSLAVTGMSLANHPQVMNDKAKAKEWAARVKECGFEDGDERLKDFVEKLLAEEASK